MTREIAIPVVVYAAVFCTLLNRGHTFNVAMFAGLVAELNTMFLWHVAAERWRR